MGRLHLRNVVFPAVLLSCSVFSTLTLPFVLSDSSPVPVKLSPFFEGEIQPIFTGENKTFTIRYIGGAIVASVSAGLLTVEVLRRVQNQSQADESALPANDQAFVVEPIAEPSSSAPVFDMEAFTPLPALVEEFTKSSQAEVAALSAETTASVAVLEEQGETCQISLN